MVEVSKAALSAGWVTGRVAAGAAPTVLDAVLAAAEPTLVVLDDAEVRAGEAAELVRRVTLEGPFDPPVKLVLLMRNSDAFKRLLQELVPSELAVSRPSVDLEVIGGDGDRRRWFAEAVRAYAKALLIKAPPVSELDKRPVGVAGEPMVVTQARAALTALDGTAAGVTSLRSAPLDVIVEEVVHRERQRWRAIINDSSLRLPASFTVQACEDAVLSLILFAPTTAPEATAALRSCPRFRHQNEDTVRNVVDAICRLYPSDPPLPVTPVPDFLLGALLARAAWAAEQDIIDASGLATAAAQRPAVVRRLLRTTQTFPSVLPLVAQALELDTDKLASAAEVLFLSGSVPRKVERVLVTAIQRNDLPEAHAERLLRLIGEYGWDHVRIVLHRVQVAHARTAATADSGSASADLATALGNLGPSLRKVGEWREALAVCRESVALWRNLAEAEPAAHTAGLAKALTNLGSSLYDLGERREALAVCQESVALWRELAAAEPATHTTGLAKALIHLRASLDAVGERREALAVCQESVGLWRELVVSEPAAHTADLAKALINLGSSLKAVGKRRQALGVRRKSVTLWRKLATTEPEAHTEDLAKALTNLATTMCGAGDHDDELKLRAEAVARFALLARQHPDEAEDHYHRARSDFAQQCSDHSREPGFALRAEHEALHTLADDVVVDCRVHG
jgi:tetratricopeptide (TPR) repeat protein